MKTMTVRVTEEEYDRITELCEKSGLKRPDVIRRAIANEGFFVLDYESAQPFLEAASRTVTETRRLSRQIRQLAAGGISDEGAEKIIKCAESLERKCEEIREAVRKTVFRRKSWLQHDESQ